MIARVSAPPTAGPHSTCLADRIAHIDEECADWDRHTCLALIDELNQLRATLLEHERAMQPSIDNLAAEQRTSARNLAHYLALRRQDLRALQERLAWLGVSSLGRSEAHVLANLDKVLDILHRLCGLPCPAHVASEPIGFTQSRALLERHAADLLGAPASGRHVRIMVTLPAEAAHDYRLVKRLVTAGMEIARINCAHDDATAWRAMAANVRRAAKATRRPLRILMDLAGPKLRTGALQAGPQVLKLRPHRDTLGRLLAPARVGLRPAGSQSGIKGAEAHIGVDAEWLSGLQDDDLVELVDARGARRCLRLVERCGAGMLAEVDKTTYLIPQSRLKRLRPGKGQRTTTCADLPVTTASLTLSSGDLLRLTRADDIDTAASGPAPKQRRNPPAHAIPCSLPEVFAQTRVGERIFFDDGRIGGVIRRCHADWLDVEITQARPGGEKLMTDKGINLPDSRLDLPALTTADLENLAVAAEIADMVGLSFVQEAADVHALQDHLKNLDSSGVGLVLKIETQRAFAHLPELLMAAMSAPAAGVMIARGDLAVECGYERLAELQEEILWAAEAAHMPVIWATQVLESLVKSGLPSRAEITDAAMGERAECVMLNKGLHIVEGIAALDGILRRMQTHQSKKRPLLRALQAWPAPLKPTDHPPAPAEKPKPPRRRRENSQPPG